MKELATSPAADPSLDVQMENQNRLAMEGGTAAFELNYPFVYPAMKLDNPKLFKHFKWALYPEVTPGVPAKVTIGGIDLAVSAYSQHKALAFQAALCLRDAQNQIIGANVGGVPPTITSLYNNPKLFADYPFHADILQGAGARQRPAEVARLPGRLHRHLAPDLAGRPASTRPAPSSQWSASSMTPCNRRAWSREPPRASSAAAGKEPPMSAATAGRGRQDERPRRKSASCRRARGPSAGSAGCCARRPSSSWSRVTGLPGRLRHLPVARALQPGATRRRSSSSGSATTPRCSARRTGGRRSRSP